MNLSQLIPAGFKMHLELESAIIYSEKAVVAKIGFVLDMICHCIFALQAGVKSSEAVFKQFANVRHRKQLQQIARNENGWRSLVLLAFVPRFIDNCTVLQYAVLVDSLFSVSRAWLSCFRCPSTFRRCVRCKCALLTALRAGSRYRQQSKQWQPHIA